MSPDGNNAKQRRKPISKRTGFLYIYVYKKRQCVSWKQMWKHFAFFVSKLSGPNRSLLSYKITGFVTKQRRSFL